VETAVDAMGELNLACRSRVEVTKALTHAGEAAGKHARMRMLGICRINKLLFHQGLVKDQVVLLLHRPDG
jgi:hypothetical protein